MVQILLLWRHTTGVTISDVTAANASSPAKRSYSSTKKIATCQYCARTAMNLAPVKVGLPATCSIALLVTNAVSTPRTRAIYRL